MSTYPDDRYEAGKREERERIIALLEAQKWTDGTDPEYSIDEVVALIKGENNG